MVKGLAMKMPTLIQNRLITDEDVDFV